MGGCVPPDKVPPDKIPPDKVPPDQASPEGMHWPVCRQTGYSGRDISGGKEVLERNGAGVTAFKMRRNLTWTVRRETTGQNVSVAAIHLLLQSPASDTSDTPDRMTPVYVRWFGIYGIMAG